MSSRNILIAGKKGLKTLRSGNEKHFHACAQVFLYIGICHRGASRQAVRPGRRRHTRCYDQGRPQKQGRLRGGGHYRPGHRTGRDNHQDLRGDTRRCTEDSERYRLHRSRLSVRLPEPGHDSFHQEAIAQYQCGSQQGPGGARNGQKGGRTRPYRRGRPGYDVRLCLHTRPPSSCRCPSPWRTS